MQTFRLNGLATASRLLLVSLFLISAERITAQSETGLSIGIEAEKKLSKKASASIEGGFRSRNDFKTADRWDVSLSADYKLSKAFKVAGGYQFIVRNNREGLSYNFGDDGSLLSYNNYRPSYWGLNHRFFAGITADHKIGDIRFSLRERWQMTIRPEQDADRYDFDNSKWEEKTRASKTKHQLRSRFQAQYDKKKTRLSPFLSAELYNGLAIDKIRYTAGTSYKLSKQHSLTFHYRYQDQRHQDPLEYDPDIHLLTFAYKYKF